MITVLQEQPEVCVGTLTYLFYRHGKEVIGEDYNLNLMLFTDAIRNRALRFFVARDEKGEAVGYSCYALYTGPMRAHELTADCHAIYVLPEYRGRVSIKLIKTAELWLKKEGVKRVYMHAPIEHPEIADMLCKEKMGFYKSEYLMEKVI